MCRQGYARGVANSISSERAIASNATNVDSSNAQYSRCWRGSSEQSDPSEAKRLGLRAVPPYEPDAFQRWFQMYGPLWVNGKSHIVRARSPANSAIKPAQAGDDSSDCGPGEIRRYRPECQISHTRSPASINPPSSMDQSPILNSRKRRSAPISIFGNMISSASVKRIGANRLAPM
jgi:hypothetical protein